MFLRLGPGEYRAYPSEVARGRLGGLGGRAVDLIPEEHGTSRQPSPSTADHLPGFEVETKPRSLGQVKVGSEPERARMLPFESWSSSVSAVLYVLVRASGEKSLLQNGDIPPNRWFEGQLVMHLFHSHGVLGDGPSQLSDLFRRDLTS